MEKKWKILHPEKTRVTALQQSLRINHALCGVLVQRGIETFEQARDFFRPNLTQLHSPWLMKDMEKAVSRILTAINNREKILVFGDYDVDGTTAVSSMYMFLKKLGAFHEFYIPHRYREGYGVSKAGIDYAIQNGFSLVLSLDCGIKSVELIRFAKENGVDFIICDHHLPDDTVPPAVAILNPKQKDCSYPFKDLCGCGVGFKLMQALAERTGLPEDIPFDYLDLLATAIAADIVSMTGENRILAYHGLIKANRNPNPGIRALCKLSGLSGEMHITNLVFMIAPRINAAGRMDDAKKAVNMFVASTEQDALHFAEQLHSDNTDRKEADKSITVEALSLINENISWKERKSTVVFQPHWHKGVVGIVASRLIEHYYRPTVVLTQSGDLVTGSARSVPGFNLYEAIHACKDHLLGYGGHFAAAGMTMELAQVNLFREKFEEIVSSSILDDQLVPEIVIDAEITFKDIRKSFHDIICQMQPFGPDNLCPVFIVKKVEDTGWSRVLKEEHIRFSLKQDGIMLNGIGFGMASKFQLLKQNKPVDIVFTIDMNEWNGEQSLQLKMIDFRLNNSTN